MRTLLAVAVVMLGALMQASEAPTLEGEQKLFVLNAAKTVQIARMAAALAEQRYALLTKPFDRPGFVLDVDINAETVTYRPIAAGEGQAPK